MNHRKPPPAARAAVNAAPRHATASRLVIRPWCLTGTLKPPDRFVPSSCTALKFIYLHKNSTEVQKSRDCVVAKRGPHRTTSQPVQQSEDQGGLSSVSQAFSAASTVTSSCCYHRATPQPPPPRATAATTAPTRGRQEAALSEEAFCAERGPPPASPRTLQLRPSPTTPHCRRRLATRALHGPSCRSEIRSSGIARSIELKILSSVSRQTSAEFSAHVLFGA